LQQGLVDATLVPVSFDLRASKLGFNILARAQEIYSYAGGGLAATTKKIKEKPEEIKRVIKAGIKATSYVKGNPDGTIQAYMDWRRTDRKTAATSYEFLSKAINEDGSLSQQGFRLLIEEIRESVKLSREISFNEVSDLSILWEAQKELRIKGK
jgi:ABC-type nitrate/sulfonate/bicarbonate transport system substrate-binding protein